MRVLIDTNIFIYREGHTVIPDSLQQLEKKLKENRIEVLVHPESFKEVKDDPDEQRRSIRLSKISTYPQLEVPVYAVGKETAFDSNVGEAKSENDRVDNSILYSVYRDAVDYLITNDMGLIKKGAKLGISERVLEIDDALDLFKKLYPEPRRPSAPPSIEEVLVSSLDVNDPILGTLRSEYYDFVDWFKNISRKGRKAWIYRNEDKTLGAIMIYKLEDDPLELKELVIPSKKRVKICLLKSEAQGQKLGELFLKMAFDFALKNKAVDLYLTHFTKDTDPLVGLIENYGFYRIGKTKKYGDDVFYKRIYVEDNELETKDPVALDKLFYPACYDGAKVNKFLVPIQPSYHERLFIEQPRTIRLTEFVGQMIVEGNTITKAYLCHAKIGKMKAGDVVLFYQSGGKSEITCVGTIEKTYQKQTDASKIQKLVGKRTVYSLKEIEEMAVNPTLVILFRWHFNIKKLVNYKTLKQVGILAGPPQSIIQLKEEHYQAIKKLGEIEPELTLH